MGMSMGGGGSGGGGGMWGSSSWKMRELAKTEKLDWMILKRALRAFVPYWRNALIVSVVLLATSAGGVIPAWLTQRIIDNGILGGRLSLVIELTLVLILVAVVTGLLGVLQTWLSNIIAQDVMADYRLRLFKHVERQSVGFFASRQSGDLVSRVMNDVSAIQNVINNTLIGFASNILVIVSTLVFMFSMNWQLTVLALVVVPGFVLPTQKVGRSRQKLQGRIQERLSTLTVQLTEQFGVSGALLTRIFNREKRETERFDEDNRDLRNLYVRQSVVGRWLFMWIGMFSSVGPALLWGYGGWLAIHHQMGIGTIVAFTSLLSRLYSPFSQLAQVQVNLLSSIALFRRIFAILDIVPEVEGGSVELAAGSIRGRIELRDVAFSYQQNTDNPALALAKISLVAEPGHMVALVGPSGAGKTTLLHLLPRFSDPLEGQILIDDYDARSLTLDSLRSQMGLVPQDPFFFHDTIRQNLLFASADATDTDLREACQAAQIYDMIAGLPDGFDTVVGERGYRLSGGERQRLAIARVLLRAPRIVLLDEATSALDTLVERQIQDALAALMKGRTAVVIAHRLSTILAADLIVVLDHGEIVAQGRHETLLATCALYRQLYEAQFAQEGASLNKGKAESFDMVAFANSLTSPTGGKQVVL
ncbi:MAG: ABC transporter ATP-binding protein [Firmicutes bacterium]|nr:ABC transporter ATP-binding protein [Bacillota bacterium]